MSGYKTEEQAAQFINELALRLANRKVTLNQALEAAYDEGFNDGKAVG